MPQFNNLCTCSVRLWMKIMSFHQVIGMLFKTIISFGRDCSVNFSTDCSCYRTKVWFPTTWLTIYHSSFSRLSNCLFYLSWSTEIHWLHMSTFCQKTYTENNCRLFNITVHDCSFHKIHYLEAERDSGIFIRLWYTLCIKWVPRSPGLLRKRWFPYTKEVLIIIKS